MSMISNLLITITIIVVVTTSPSVVFGFVSTNVRPLVCVNSKILLEKPLPSSTLLYAAHVRGNGEKSSARETSSLLNEFRIASGEIIDPYKVLKVARDASRDEIKAGYRNLSRMYHPDQIRFRKTLPGRCNNLEDVREEWERINLAYVILSDRRTRKRYDRNFVLADPGAALTDAAMGSLKWGVTSLAKGIFNAGTTALDKSVTMAMDSLFKEEEKVADEQQAEYQIREENNAQNNGLNFPSFPTVPENKLKNNAFNFPKFPTLPNFQQPKKEEVEESYHVPINALNPSPMIAPHQLKVEEVNEAKKENNNILYFNVPQTYKNSRNKKSKSWWSNTS